MTTAKRTMPVGGARPDGAALADHHATPDRAPAGLARQNSEAVMGACTMMRGRLRPPFSCAQPLS
jgi:hypothetical protein